ncbi:hypothetical protein CVM52_22875 [Pseudooceanicola lipolyticus]|uniref:Uncharacterized protein n=1 Tax=Pseudooceanicola lipolyticus TaxID=2029104 RepID=A0A2M8IUX9_9RHOB|nr:hypothetical protein CVM52_22875 [Pseudooceanicola lipolyticus]
MILYKMYETCGFRPMKVAMYRIVNAKGIVFNAFIRRQFHVGIDRKAPCDLYRIFTIDRQ